MTILNLISGPRNISTALMYSFAQRDDTAVLDEPFYAMYLKKSDAIHPGQDEVMLSQSQDEKTVKHQIESSTGKPILFIKNMAHHMEVMEDPFIKNSFNLFLIRNPKQIIASYAQVIKNPVMRDIGIEYQYKLFKLLEKKNKPFAVIDSGLLLASPESVLQHLCQRCAIGFQKSMLNWKAGSKSYDGIWAKYWYSNVHKSTGFEQQRSSSQALPVHLEPLYQQAMGYYEKLLPISLKA